MFLNIKYNTFESIFNFYILVTLYYLPLLSSQVCPNFDVGFTLYFLCFFAKLSFTLNFNLTKLKVEIALFSKFQTTHPPHQTKRIIFDLIYGSKLPGSAPTSTQLCLNFTFYTKPTAK